MWQGSKVLLNETRGRKFHPMELSSPGTKIPGDESSWYLALCFSFVLDTSTTLCTIALPLLPTPVPGANLSCMVVIRVLMYSFCCTSCEYMLWRHHRSSLRRQIWLQINSQITRAIAHALPALSHQISHRVNLETTAHNFTITQFPASILTNMRGKLRQKAIHWRQIWQYMNTEFTKTLLLLQNYYRSLVLNLTWVTIMHN